MNTTELNTKGILHISTALFLLIAGIILMAYMIYAESEPGGLPLLMILIGITWLVIARRRFKSR